MPLCLLGISRHRDLSRTVQQSIFEQVDAHWIVDDELAGAVIDLPDRRLPPLRHAAVLDAIHRQFCVLPMQFGTAFFDETELRRLLHTQKQELLETLRRLDGTHEMGVRITFPACPFARAVSPRGTTSPNSYLRERRAYYRNRDLLDRRAQLTLDHLLEQLQDSCRECKTLASSTPGLLRLAFLVERERVRAFRTSLQGVITAHHARRWTLLGPWPPYSFV